MGLGDDTWGDPIPDVPPIPNDPVILARPAALIFDPIARDFPLDANGHYIALHPVDAAVQTALLHIAGRIPSSPDTGWAIDTLRAFTSDRASKTADTLVRAALDPLITRGDITLVSVRYEAQPAGPATQVSYFNNRLLPKPIEPTKLYVSNR